MRYVDRRMVQTIEDIDAYLEREYSSLQDAIEAQPTPPCDDRGDGRACEHKVMCGLNNLACASFFAYTREPGGGMSFIGWPRMDRRPSAKLYEKTHKDYG